MDCILKMTLECDLCLFHELRLKRPRQEWALSLLFLNRWKCEQQLGLLTCLATALSTVLFGGHRPVVWIGGPGGGGGNALHCEEEALGCLGGNPATLLYLRACIIPRKCTYSDRQGSGSTDFPFEVYSCSSRTWGVVRDWIVFPSKFLCWSPNP